MTFIDIRDQKFLGELRASAIEAVADVVHAANHPDPTYPEDHAAGMHVPKGGSNCAKCEYLADNKVDCTNKYFQKWNGGPKIPGKIDEYCSDWFEEKEGIEDLEAGGPGSGRHPEDDSEKLKQKLPEEVTALHTAAFKQALEENEGKWSSGVGSRAQEILEQWMKEGKKLDAGGNARKKKEKKIKSAIDNSQRGQFSGTLWNDIKMIGFSGPEEEGLRAMLSRIPPELFYNVKEFKSAKELGVKHGRFIPETQTILYNPRNFAFRQRFGEGQGWMQHVEMTTAHEIGHSLYETLTPDELQEWLNCSGWVEGHKEGNAPPYVEVRPGWPYMKSAWTHRAGVKFTRHYAEKNPNEQFADCFSFFMLGKGFQMEPACREFLEKFVKDKVKWYPSISIQSPAFAYPKQEAIRKSASV